MTEQRIIDWLTYWSIAGMVSIENIRAFDQVHLARKFCRCMRTGLFADDLVTDLQIWRALQSMRAAALLVE